MDQRWALAGQFQMPGRLSLSSAPMMPTNRDNQAHLRSKGNGYPQASAFILLASTAPDKHACQVQAEKHATAACQPGQVSWGRGGTHEKQQTQQNHRRWRGRPQGPAPAATHGPHDEKMHCQESPFPSHVSSTDCTQAHASHPATATPSPSWQGLLPHAPRLSETAPPRQGGAVGGHSLRATRSGTPPH